MGTRRVARALLPSGRHNSWTGETCAAERSVSRPVLVEQLRDAVDELAMEYENVACAGVVETEQDRVLASLAGKRGHK